jgi:hypothetical protein
MRGRVIAALAVAVGGYGAAFLGCSSDPPSAAPSDAGDESFGVPRHEGGAVVDSAVPDLFDTWKTIPTMPCTVYVAPDPVAAAPMVEWGVCNPSATGCQVLSPTAANNGESSFSTEVRTAGGTTYLIDHLAHRDLTGAIRYIDSVRKMDGLVPVLVTGYLTDPSTYCRSAVTIGEYGVALSVQTNDPERLGLAYAAWGNLSTLATHVLLRGDVSLGLSLNFGSVAVGTKSLFIPFTPPAGYAVLDPASGALHVTSPDAGTNDFSNQEILPVPDGVLRQGYRETPVDGGGTTFSEVVTLVHDDATSTDLLVRSDGTQLSFFTMDPTGQQFVWLEQGYVDGGFQTQTFTAPYASDPAGVHPQLLTSTLSISDFVANAGAIVTTTSPASHVVVVRLSDLAGWTVSRPGQPIWIDAQYVWMTHDYGLERRDRAILGAPDLQF